MKVNRGALAQVLELVSPGLSSREVIEQSNSYCFRDNQVITYNDEVAVIARSPLQLTGAVPAEPFRDILFKLKDDVLDISKEDTTEQLVIRGKNQKVVINMDSKIELPLENLKIPKTWKRLPENFSEALRLVETCAGKDESQFALTCIHLHPRWVEAYDTYQFARYTINLDLERESFIKQTPVKHLTDLDMKEFAETEEWMYFRNESKLIMACRRYEEKYPQLDKLVQLKGKKVVLPKGLAEIADRAEVFSQYNTENNRVRVDIKPSKVSIKGEGQCGYYRGVRKLPSYDGPELSFLIHPRLFIQIVKQHPECMLCEQEHKALKVELGQFTFVASLSEVVK